MRGERIRLMQNRKNSKKIRKIRGLISICLVLIFMASAYSRPVKADGNPEVKAVLEIEVSYHSDFSDSQTISFEPFYTGFNKEKIDLDGTQEYFYLKINRMAVVQRGSDGNPDQLLEVSDFSKVQISFQNAGGMYEVAHTGRTVKIPMSLLNQKRDEYDGLHILYEGNNATLNFAGEGSAYEFPYEEYAGTYVNGSHKLTLENDGLAAVDGKEKSDAPFILTDIKLNENGAITDSHICVYTYDANLYFTWDEAKKTLTYVKSGGGNQSPPDYMTVGAVFQKASLNMEKTSMDMKVGETKPLPLKVTPSDSKAAVTYESSNPAIASVDADGKVTAKGIGKAEIKAVLGSVISNMEISVYETDAVSSIPSQDIINQIDGNKDITVNLTGPDKLDADVLKAIKGAGNAITLNIQGNGSTPSYTWSFDGKTVTDPNVNVDLKIDISKKSRDEGLGSLLEANEGNSLILVFSHSGRLPGPAKITVDVSEYGFKDGEKIYLYYYDPDKEALIRTGEGIVKDGQAEFTITHCSTYVISDNKSLDEEKPDEAQLKNDPGNDGRNTDQNQSGNGSSPKGNAADTGDDTSVVPWLIALIAALLGGGAAFVLRKKAMKK